MARHSGGRDASDRERTVLERAGINARKVGGAALRAHDQVASRPPDPRLSMTVWLPGVSASQRATALATSSWRSSSSMPSSSGSRRTPHCLCVLRILSRVFSKPCHTRVGSVMPPAAQPDGPSGGGGGRSCSNSLSRGPARKQPSATSSGTPPGRGGSPSPSGRPWWWAALQTACGAGPSGSGLAGTHGGGAE